MNRQEAAIIIKAIGKHAIETHLTDPGDIVDATVMAVEALVPKPDEATGLVPCGCGGKAVIHDHQNYGEPGMNYWVGCDNQKCDCTVGMYLDETGRFEKKEDAIKTWNKAHGYKGGAE